MSSALISRKSSVFTRYQNVVTTQKSVFTFSKALHTLFVTACFLIGPRSYVLARGSSSLTTSNEQDSFNINNPCKGFKVVVGDLNKAKTVFIAELHNERESTLQCLNQLTKNKRKHTVLLESWPAGMVVPCEDNSVQGRTCLGWDTLNALEEQFYHVLPSDVGRNDLISNIKFFQYEIKKFLEKNNMSEELLNKIISSQKNEVNTALKYLLRNEPVPGNTNIKKQYEGKSLEESLQFLLRARLAITLLLDHKIKRGLTYKELSDDKNIEIRKSFREICHLEHKCENLKKNEQKRSQKLLNSAKSQKEFTVLINGKAHLLSSKSKDPLHIVMNEEAAYVQSELEKNKDQNPYVILVKEDSSLKDEL